MAAPLQLIHAFLSANIKVCLECLDPTLGCLLYDCPEDRTEVDFIPDQKNKTLRVRLHPLISEVHDQVVCYPCEELTSTETVFLGTGLRLIYEIAGSANSAGSGCLSLSISLTTT